MRAVALFGALTLAAASAQTLVPQNQIANFLVSKQLDPLKCQAEALRPVLDFSFRFHAGYTVRAPLDQYSGPGHKWAIVVQIQPESGPAVYFVERLNLPAVSGSKAEAAAGGGYLLGVGRYRTTLLLLDDQSRICRADWTIDARLGANDRGVKMSIPPGAIQEMSTRGTAAASPHQPPLNRLTVLLHAAPVFPRMTKVQPGDTVTLLGALSSLLTLAPARSVRLVVFNLDQQKEIYRADQFTPDQLPALRQAIFDLQLATVDYHQLQNPAGHLDLLTHLADQEMHAENPADAVVFLGPHARSSDKPVLDAENRRAGVPKFFYVEYQLAQPIPYSGDQFNKWGTTIPGTTQSPQRVAEDGVSGIGEGGDGHTVVPNAVVMESMDGAPRAIPPRDSIDYLVSLVKGKTMVVRTPAEFAKAIDQIAPAKGK